MTHLRRAARITFAAMFATLVVPTTLDPPRASAAPLTSKLEAVAPCRVADSRNGTGFASIAADRIRVAMVGRCGVPPDATAVAVTVTATQAQAAGFLTAWPAGQPLPNASTVNYGASEDRANGAIVKLGTDGAIDVTASAPTGIIVDVNGWFRPATSASAGRYVPITAQRVFDSRAPGFARPLQPGETITLAPPAGVPSDAIALAINITTTAPNQPGFFTAFPAGTARPEASLLNTDRSGQTRAAASITPISPGGLSVYSHSGGHLIIDVTGWFTGPSAGESTDGLFIPADSPQRLVDTRAGDPMWPGGAIEVAVPVTGASSIVVNTTLVDAHAWGFLTAYAARTSVPETSTVNVGAKHETAANLAIVPISTSGMAVSSFGGADLVVDLAGWFVGSPVAPTIGEAPTNVRPPVCIADTSPASLTVFFASGDPIIGADYQRAYPLPDGRTLWMFQDVLLRSRAGSTFAHNAGLIQSGNCFDVLQSGNYAVTRQLRVAGRDDDHAALVLGARRRHGRRRTVPPLRRRDARARSRVPVVDRADRDVERLDRPHRHVDRGVRARQRQLERAVRVLGHVGRVVHVPVLALLPAVRVGPVAVRRPAAVRARLRLHSERQRRASAARPLRRRARVLERVGVGRRRPRPYLSSRENRLVNPTQVMFDGHQFVAVTKEGDWWGNTIYLDVAPTAQGPWHTYWTIAAPTECSICNTYFASIVPWRATQRVARSGTLAQHVRRHPDRALLTALLHRPGAVR